MLVQKSQAESTGPFAEKTENISYFHTLHVMGSFPAILQSANLLKPMIYVLLYVYVISVERKQTHQECNTLSFRKDGCSRWC